MWQACSSLGTCMFTIEVKFYQYCASGWKILYWLRDSKITRSIGRNYIDPIQFFFFFSFFFLFWQRNIRSQLKSPTLSPKPPTVELVSCLILLIHNTTSPPIITSILYKTLIYIKKNPYQWILAHRPNITGPETMLEPQHDHGLEKEIFLAHQIHIHLP